MSKLLKTVTATVTVEEDTLRLPTAAPAQTRWSLPPEIIKAIGKEVAADPSDPFLARRLAAHYRQGVWSPV